nr:immunoglobulin light chain junction region [Macaca mulatta]
DYYCALYMSSVIWVF